MGDCIRETRAIEMDFETVVMGGLGQGGQFVGCVDRAAFGGLGQAQGGGLGGMQREMG